jgi:hypothetical protein
MTALRGKTGSAERYAQLDALWRDLFVVVLPLLRELDPTVITDIMQQRGDDFVAAWVARAVKLLRDNHTAIGFYSHLLLHWRERARFAASLPLPAAARLSPASFGQDSDESEWHSTRRQLLHHTTFNGGHASASLSAISAVQLVQRKLELVLLRWLLRLPLLPDSHYLSASDDDTIDADDDATEVIDDGGSVALASPPASFDALIALLAQLRSHYLPPAAAQQHQRVVSAQSQQPVVSHTTISHVMLDERANATEFKRPLLAPDELVQLVRARVPESKRVRFDAEQMEIAQVLADLTANTVDVTK